MESLVMPIIMPIEFGDAYHYVYHHTEFERYWLVTSGHKLIFVFVLGLFVCMIFLNDYLFKFNTT